jgi:hypothetical protein
VPQHLNAIAPGHANLNRNLRTRPVAKESEIEEDKIMRGQNHGRGDHEPMTKSIGGNNLGIAHDGEYGDAGLSVRDLRTRQEIARFPAGEGGEPLLCSPTQSLLAFASVFPNVPPGAGGRRGRSVIRLWDGSRYPEVIAGARAGAKQGRRCQRRGGPGDRHRNEFHSAT